MIGLKKIEKRFYPQIFVQNSMKTQYGSYIFQFKELKTVGTKVQIGHFVSLIEQNAPLSQMSKVGYEWS